MFDHLATVQIVTSRLRVLERVEDSYRNQAGDWTGKAERLKTNQKKKTNKQHPKRRDSQKPWRKRLGKVNLESHSLGFNERSEAVSSGPGPPGTSYTSIYVGILLGLSSNNHAGPLPLAVSVWY